jgi:uncharacterized protein DUF6459
MTVLQDPPLPRPVRPAPDDPPPAVRVRRARYEPEPGETGHAPPLPPALPALPAQEIITSAQAAAAQRAIVPVLRLALEVLDGRRPPAHLDPVTAPTVLRYWRAACGQRRPTAPARLGGLRLCLPAPDVAEVAAVCAMDGRVRALAARFERAPGGPRGWRWTVARLG